MYIAIIIFIPDPDQILTLESTPQGESESGNLTYHYACKGALNLGSG